MKSLFWEMLGNWVTNSFFIIGAILFVVSVLGLKHKSNDVLSILCFVASFVLLTISIPISLFGG